MPPQAGGFVGSRRREGGQDTRLGRREGRWEVRGRKEGGGVCRGTRGPGVRCQLGEYVLGMGSRVYHIGLRELCLLGPGLGVMESSSWRA